MGVYHYFRDAAVTVQSAIVAPTALEPYFVSPLTVPWKHTVAVLNNDFLYLRIFRFFQNMEP